MESTSEVDKTIAKRSISVGDVPFDKMTAAERAAERKMLQKELDLEERKMEVDGKLGREVVKMADNLKVRQELWDESSQMVDEMIMLLHEHHNPGLVDSKNEETIAEADDPEKTLTKRFWWARKMMELKEKKREMEERKTEFEETMRKDCERMRDVLDEYSQLFDDLFDYIR